MSNSQPGSMLGARQIGYLYRECLLRGRAENRTTAASKWQNRLDFRRKGRIAVCVGWRTRLRADPLRARPAMCGAWGRASVNSDAATQRSPRQCRPLPSRSPTILSAPPRGTGAPNRTRQLVPRSGPPRPTPRSPPTSTRPQPKRRAPRRTRHLGARLPHPLR